MPDRGTGGPACEPKAVLVIGGGAAGIIAARRAAEMGATVTMLEKNPRLGMKILISGGGKCNLTHDGAMEDIRRRFRANEALFLKPAFHRYTNRDFLRILHERGIKTYVRPDGRIFPVEPTNAKDIVACLTRYVEEAGVDVRYNAPATGISAIDGRLTGVAVGDELLKVSRVIICTGGSSYPATGATGDGWRWLRDVGHIITPLRSALAPIYLENAKPDWSGVALRDIVLKTRNAGGKEICRWTGDLLFTHKGISGPAALAVSRDTAEMIENGSASTVEVDLVPALSFEKLQACLRSETRSNPRRTAATLAAPYVPSRLIEPVMASAGVPPALRLSNLPAKSLNRILSTIKAWPLGKVRHIPLERGEVVAGGVALDEVDPQTMESRLVKGLYLCGEVLDIAGPVGGYNLQAAWSTGYVAGESAARDSSAA